VFDGQLLFQSSTVYSPWFRRGGDHARFTLEVIEAGSASITVELYTKAADDAGDGTALGAGTPLFSSVSAVGRTTAEFLSTANDGMKDLVRYEFTVTGSGTNWILFRMLDPVWFDSVVA